MPTTKTAKKKLWSSTAPTDSEYIVVGCVPGDYLLEPPASLPTAARQRDPASDGFLNVIHKNQLYMFAPSKYDKRPVWQFMAFRDWWDNPGVKLPGVEPTDHTSPDSLPPSGTPARELKLLSELAESNLALSTLRSKVLETIGTLKQALGLPVD